MSGARTVDVRSLPPGAFGSRSLMWWGTMGMILIESTAFGLAIASAARRQSATLSSSDTANGSRSTGAR